MYNEVEANSKAYAAYESGGIDGAVNYLVAKNTTVGTGANSYKTNADYFENIFSATWGTETDLQTYLASAPSVDRVRQVYGEQGAEVAIEYLHLMNDADYNGDREIYKEEAMAFLNSRNLTNLQKAYLLHMKNKSWKNPY